MLCDRWRSPLTLSSLDDKATVVVLLLAEDGPGSAGVTWGGKGDALTVTGEGWTAGDC